MGCQQKLLYGADIFEKMGVNAFFKKIFLAKIFYALGVTNDSGGKLIKINFSLYEFEKDSPVLI